MTTRSRFLPALTIASTLAYALLIGGHHGWMCDPWWGYWLCVY